MKRRKVAYKLSTIILTVLLTLIIAGIFASNIILKKVYDKVDKSDVYWNYNIILSQPYKYLKIDGGNITTIMFEQSKKPSVRVLNYWDDYKKDSSLSVHVKNDTLFLKFPNKYRNEGEKEWMQSQVLVRLFAPQLLSIDGSDTNFELQKLKQANINIRLSGNSRLEVETYLPNFDNLNVTQSDSSQVVFEMSPDLKVFPIMHFNNVSANMTGYTLLDVGRSYIDHVKLNISDSSAVILSGKSLRAIPK